MSQAAVYEATRTLTDDDVARLAHPGLVNLVLGATARVSDAGLAEVGAVCAALEALYLAGGYFSVGEMPFVELRAVVRLLGGGAPGADGGDASAGVDGDAALRGKLVAYLGGEGNFLRPLVGVEDFDSDILGVVKAGTSTALGFVAFQSIQNLTFKNGAAWLDPAEPAAEVAKEALPQASFS